MCDAESARPGHRHCGGRVEAEVQSVCVAQQLTPESTQARSACHRLETGTGQATADPQGAATSADRTHVGERGHRSGALQPAAQSRREAVAQCSYRDQGRSIDARRKQRIGAATRDRDPLQARRTCAIGEFQQRRIEPPATIHGLPSQLAAHAVEPGARRRGPLTRRFAAQLHALQRQVREHARHAMPAQLRPGLRATAAGFHGHPGKAQQWRPLGQLGAS